MTQVPIVSTGNGFAFSLGGLNRVLVAATGTVPTSGWSEEALSPRYYVVPPADGVWEFDFLADAPSGIVLQVTMPVVASGLFAAPPWLKGIRIIGATNSVEVTLAVESATEVDFSRSGFEKTARSGNVIYKREIAVYDDSFQPIGLCSGFGSIKMKKLRHELTLTVEGPDDSKIRGCVERAVGAGLVAAIVAAYVTGGIALSAAVSAFISTLRDCLGDGFSVRIDDRSHWIKWCT